jgi:hypothetical protein
MIKNRGWITLSMGLFLGCVVFEGCLLTYGIRKVSKVEEIKTPQKRLSKDLQHAVQQSSGQQSSGQQSSGQQPSRKEEFSYLMEGKYPF